MRTDRLTITYGRSPKRKSAYVRLLPVAIALLILYASGHLVERVAHRVWLLIRQADCMTCDLRDPCPYEERIVLGEDADSSAALPPSLVVDDIAAATKQPTCWDEFGRLCGWPRPNEKSVCLILHKFLGREDGKPYILIVEYELPPTPLIGGPSLTYGGYKGVFTQSATLHFSIVVPAGITGTPSLVAGSCDVILLETAEPGIMSVGAGTTDPVDQSHFVIPFRFAGHRSSIDGRLINGTSIRWSCEKIIVGDPINE